MIIIIIIIMIIILIIIIIMIEMIFIIIMMIMMMIMIMILMMIMIIIVIIIIIILNTLSLSLCSFFLWLLNFWESLIFEPSKCGANLQERRYDIKLFAEKRCPPQQRWLRLMTDKKAKASQNKRLLGSGLFDGIRLQDSCLEVFRLTADTKTGTEP